MYKLKSSKMNIIITDESAEHLDKHIGAVRFNKMFKIIFSDTCKPTHEFNIKTKKIDSINPGKQMFTAV